MLGVTLNEDIISELKELVSGICDFIERDNNLTKKDKEELEKLAAPIYDKIYEAENQDSSSDSSDAPDLQNLPTTTHQTVAKTKPKNNNIIFTVDNLNDNPTANETITTAKEEYILLY